MNRIDVLDHGYVELIESWGSDRGIVETARTSTQKGFQGWEEKCKACGSVLVVSEFTAPYTGNGEEPYHRPKHCADCLAREFVPGDGQLLGYLAKNHHDTPFEFAGFTIEVQAPIFVFREWHRHRTQSFSEASARYAPLEALDYMPTVERLLMSGGANKQAGAVKGSEVLDREGAVRFQEMLRLQYQLAERLYRSSLEQGVPKELARVCLPVGRYSKMRASTDLRNWAGFCRLRCDSHAQWEIQQYANVVSRFARECFPRAWPLLTGDATR